MREGSLISEPYILRTISPSAFQRLEMDIVDAKSVKLSNFEVLSFLKEEKNDLTKNQEKKKNKDKLLTLIVETINYLGKYFRILKDHITNTVCPRSSDPFNMGKLLYKWVTISWTYSNDTKSLLNFMFSFSFIASFELANDFKYNNLVKTYLEPTPAGKQDEGTLQVFIH